jgi:hypothetical protein
MEISFTLISDELEAQQDSDLERSTISSGVAVTALAKIAGYRKTPG